MNKFFEKIKKPASLITIILFLLVATMQIVFVAGNFNGVFLPVVGNIFYLIIIASLWASVPLFLLLKKKKFADFSFFALTAYWLISSLLSLFSDMSIGDGLDIAIATAVFSFLVACVLLATAVFFGIGCLKNNNKMKLLGLLIFLGGLTFYFVLFGLWTGLYAEYAPWANWNVYVGFVIDYFLIPCAMFFAFLAFFFNKQAPAVPVKEVEDAEELPEEDGALLEELEEEEPDSLLEDELESEPAPAVVEPAPAFEPAPKAPVAEEAPAMEEVKEEPVEEVAAAPEAPKAEPAKEEPVKPAPTTGSVNAAFLSKFNFAMKSAKAPAPVAEETPAEAAEPAESESEE